MSNKKIEFPARDKFQAKFCSAQKTVEVLEKEFEKIKQDFFKFQWYDSMVEFKAIEGQLEEMKTNLKKLNTKLFE